MRRNVICFFETLPPSGGGAALRGKAFAEALARTLPVGAFDVQLLTSTAQPNSIAGVAIKSFSNVHSDDICLLKRSWKELVLGMCVALEVSRNSAAGTILVISSPSYISACVICVAAIIRRIPYVLDVRDIYPRAYVASNLLSERGLPNRILEKLSELLYRNASIVFAATKGLTSEIQRYQTRTRVEHVPNGFPTMLLDIQAVKHERFTVCFHGVLGFFQDVESIKTLAERLTRHDIDFVVIGYGRKSHILENSNIPNLKFLGRLPFPRTIDEVAKCHVGLCLRRDEEISKDAFPVKVWEYLGLGIPAIVTPLCEAGVFLENNKCGIQLKAGAVEDIAASILNLKRNEKIYKIMQDNCKSIRVMHTREAYAINAAEQILAVLKF